MEETQKFEVESIPLYYTPGIGNYSRSRAAYIPKNSIASE